MLIMSVLTGEEEYVTNSMRIAKYWIPIAKRNHDRITLLFNIGA